jgi:hypothetical protein
MVSQLLFFSSKPKECLLIVIILFLLLIIAKYNKFVLMPKSVVYSMQTVYIVSEATCYCYVISFIFGFFYLPMHTGAWKFVFICV